VTQPCDLILCVIRYRIPLLDNVNADDIVIYMIYLLGSGSGVGELNPQVVDSSVYRRRLVSI
jgi:hypothetical protein